MVDLNHRSVCAKSFVENGFDSKRTVHQCGSGVSSAVNHLAMVHAGLEGSRIYNGSWSEWVSDPGDRSLRASDRRRDGEGLAIAPAAGLAGARASSGVGVCGKSRQLSTKQ